MITIALAFVWLGNKVLVCVGRNGRLGSSRKIVLGSMDSCGCVWILWLITVMNRLSVSHFLPTINSRGLFMPFSIV